MPATTSRFAQLDEELSRATVKCKVCRVIADLPAEDAEYVRSMMAQPVGEKGHQHIARVLAAGGVVVNPSTLGDCRSARHQQRD
jgi:hypothetical protein